MEGMVNVYLEADQLPNMGTEDNDPDTSTLHEKVAWPVAEKMLHTISQRKPPAGFKAAGFVKNCFEDTFGNFADQTSACPAPEHGLPEFSWKRKGSSVVDAALGIMGYDSLRVSETKGRFLVDILTSLVSSKSSCGALCDHLSKMEVPEYSKKGVNYRVHLCSQTITVKTLLEIVENCKSFFVSVNDDGTQIPEVIDALVKVVADASLFIPRSGSAGGVFKKTIYEVDGQTRKDLMWALQSITDFVIEKRDSIYSKLRPCSRLRFWRIRPSCLKQDISCLALEAMQRLLLPLDRELCERQDWAILVVCLSLAPDIFGEARRLLHHWFLSSGAFRLWELRAELVAAVWGVIGHPSVWGLNDKTHLPPKSAAYSVTLRPFIQILEADPTVPGMLKIVKLLDQVENLRQQTAKEIAAGNPLLQGPIYVDYNSIWSLLIEFLPWLHFASRILIRSSSHFLAGTFRVDGPGTPSGEAELEGRTHTLGGGALLQSSQIAARYLSWIISPTADCAQRVSDEQVLLKLSSRWNNVRKVSSHQTSSRLSEMHDYGALQAAVQAVSLTCSRCGFPAEKMKKSTSELVDESNVRRNDASTSELEVISILDLWLADLQMIFDRSQDTTGFKEMKCTVEGFPDGKQSPFKRSNGISTQRMLMSPRSDSDQNTGKSARFMVNFLSLAALAESLMTYNFDITVRLVQFLAASRTYLACWRRHSVETADKLTPSVVRLCSSCRIPVHCESCCSEEAEKSASPHPLSSQVNKKPRIASSGSQRPGRGKSIDWLPGVALIFKFLDSLGDDLLSLSGSTESDTLDVVDKKLVTNHLAVIIAEFVSQWVNSIEILSSFEISTPGGKDYYLVLLKDLHYRFCRWINKLELSMDATKLCTDSKEVIDKQIKRVKSLLLIP